MLRGMAFMPTYREKNEKDEKIKDKKRKKQKIFSEKRVERDVLYADPLQEKKKEKEKRKKGEKRRKLFF